MAAQDSVPVPRQLLFAYNTMLAEALRDTISRDPAGLGADLSRRFRVVDNSSEAHVQAMSEALTADGAAALSALSGAAVASHDQVCACLLAVKDVCLAEGVRVGLLLPQFCDGDELLLARHVYALAALAAAYGSQPRDEVWPTLCLQVTHAVAGMRARRTSEHTVLDPCVGGLLDRLRALEAGGGSRGGDQANDIMSVVQERISGALKEGVETLRPFQEPLQVLLKDPGDQKSVRVLVDRLAQTDMGKAFQSATGVQLQGDVLAKRWGELYATLGAATRAAAGAAAGGLAQGAGSVNGGRTAERLRRKLAQRK
jgi:hypothetical protein